MKLPTGFFSGGDIGSYRELYETVPVGGQTVEVGVWKGRSLCSVSTEIRRRRIRVIAVDTFQGITSMKTKLTPTERRAIQREFEENCERWNVKPLLIVADSVEAARLTPAKSCDLVFIDGDHTYEQLNADITAWLPRIKDDGLIAGHDYKRSGGSEMYDEVRRCLHERIGRDAVRKSETYFMTTVWHAHKEDVR